MINNNRQAGRRRGRGGQRQGGNPNSGNRIDNRARGNASQLLEKYKTLAADAQRQGDRVNAEYYLQFADHYFRVLAESRSRFEEQNQGQRRGREDGFDDDGDEGFEEGEGNDVQADAEPRRQQQAREDREPRRERNDRNDRNDRYERNDRGDREDRGNRANGNVHAANDGQEAEAVDASDEGRRPSRGLRPRRERAPVAANEGETFDAALLPPSLGIGVGDEGDVGGEEAPKPRRGRPRRSAAAEAAE